MIRFVPNILTFGRLVLAGIFLVMILYSPGVANHSGFLDIAFVLFVITGLTDIVDGHIARKYDVVTKLGRIMDPLADKVLVCGAFLCFAIIGRPTLFGFSATTLAIIHWSVFGVIVLREAYVTVLRHVAEARGISFAATASGKLKMFLQSFAIGTVLVKYAHVTRAWGDWFTLVVYIMMVAATIISGIRATQRKSWRQAIDSNDIAE
jgi:CDP-diacylglycerol--glycerol-3-phosphate 3-phosphatidyltransferase